MSSRVRDGFGGVFFEADREAAEPLDREASGLMKHGREGAGVAAAAAAFGYAGASAAASGVVGGVVCEIDRTGVLISGGSEEGGSEPILGLSGVRKGDLNGFFKVFVALFSLRRLAPGVDILNCRAALGVV